MTHNTFYTKEYNDWKLSFLRVLAISVFTILSILLLTRLFLPGGYTPADVALVILIVCHAAVYYIAKKGYIKFASLITTIVTFVSISYMIYRGKGIYDSAAPAYLALLIITFMLLGWKYALGVLILGISWLITLGILTHKGILVYPAVDAIPNYIRDFSAIFILVYTLSHIYIKRIGINIKRISDELEERSKAEKVIRENEENYRTIFEQASDGIIITDMQGKVMMINESMAKISGYTQADMLDQDLNTLFTDTEITDFIQQGYSTNEVFTYITSLTSKSNNTFPIEIRIKLLADERWQLFITDISERQKAEKSLRDFERIFDLSGNPICIINIHSELLKANPALQNILEFEHDELVSKKLSDLIHPDDVNATMMHIDKQASTKAKRIYTESRYVTKAGNTVWLSWVAQPVYEENIAFLIGHDVTEKKVFEDELIKAKEKAEESDRLKTAFLENMSHEIRTPMNGIIGFSDMLRNREISDDEKDKYCNIILKSGQNLLRIVNDILDISRIETGIVEINTSIVNLPELCGEMKEIMLAKLTNPDVELIFDGFKDVRPTILTDKIRLQQILNNLILNAIKFTHKGEIRVGCSLKGNMIEFYVKDTGIGIADHMQNKVFERFIQAELDIAKKYGGTGLGLAISQKLVELLGGTIWVESAIGEGSCFYFTVPYMPVKSNTNMPDAMQNPVILNKSKSGVILVVEDDIPNFEYLQAILKRAGYEVIHVEDGVAAVEMAQTRKDIILILMDIKLPRMNGYEATRKIKEHKPDIPIIAQTAFAMLKDGHKALEAGCDDYIIKPLMKKELLEIVAKHLN